MKHPKFPSTQHYVFEMTVGINSALAFCPGDISTLFVDGLFALDEEGRLFPGVTVPEKRLQLCGMEPMGYHRFGRRGTLQDTYGEVTFSSDELPKTTRELRDRLDVAVGSLDAAIPRQRMLMAKLSALTDRCHHTGALTTEDRKMAEALLTAADAIIAAVESALRPVL